MRQAYMKRTTNQLTVKNKRNFFPLEHEIGEYHKKTEKEKNNFYSEKSREGVQGTSDYFN